MKFGIVPGEYSRSSEFIFLSRLEKSNFVRSGRNMKFANNSKFRAPHSVSAQCLWRFFNFIAAKDTLCGFEASFRAVKASDLG